MLVFQSILGGLHMKKILVICLTLLILAPAIFADDAKVMPAMVGRFYVAPIFSFAPGSFDNDGDYKKFDNGSVKLLNFGFALEFGILNWVTAAAQWVPGWTPWSNIKPALGGLPFDPKGKVNTNGVGDLFLGAKLQIIGVNAPIQNNMFRFAAAPGFIIPMPGPDFKEEYKNLVDGKKATYNNMDKHIFGMGGRFYIDYIVNENFFINLYNETILYPAKTDLAKARPDLQVMKDYTGRQSAKTAIDAGKLPEAMAPTFIDFVDTSVKDVKGEASYKFRTTFEIEPVFSTFIMDGINFTAGLPINYRYSPEPKYSVSGISVPAGAEALGITEEELKNGLLKALKGASSHALNINPNVSVFFMKLPLPMEFKFQYNIPVWGKGTNAQHNIAFQVRAYFAFR